MSNDKKSPLSGFREKHDGRFIYTPKRENVYHFLIAGAATFILLAGIKAASGIIGPILLGLFMSIILLVPLRWLRRKGCPNILSLIIVIAATIILFLVLGLFVGRSLNNFLYEFQAYRDRIIEKVEALENQLEKYGFALGLDMGKQPPLEEPEPTEEEGLGDVIADVAPLLATDPPTPSSTPTATPAVPAMDPPAPAAPEPELDDGGETTKPARSEHPEEVLQEFIKTPPRLKKDDSLIPLEMNRVLRWVAISMLEIKNLAQSGFLVLIFTLFMIFEAARFPEKVDRAFGKEGPIGNEHFHHIANEIRRYLFLKAISSLMSASAATVVYLIFGVPAAFFWGLIAFFLYFIPNIGGIVASIIPGLLIFMMYDLQGVLIYAVCLITIECLIGYGIEPKMLGHGLGISTVVILLSLICWGWILGPIGLFLAAPLTIMIKITLQAFKETEWIAILLSDKIHDR